MTPLSSKQFPFSSIVLSHSSLVRHMCWSTDWLNQARYLSLVSTMMPMPPSRTYRVHAAFGFWPLIPPPHQEILIFNIKTVHPYSKRCTIILTVRHYSCLYDDGDGEENSFVALCQNSKKSFYASLKLSI